jgi:mono/diheme cytochrome c family protein
VAGGGAFGVLAPLVGLAAACTAIWTLRGRLGAFWSPVLLGAVLVGWIRLGFDPPLPSSVRWLWTAAALLAVGLHVGASSAGLDDFRVALRSLVLDPGSRRLRLACALGLPAAIAVHGYAAGSADVARPATFRVVHPAPPTWIDYREPWQTEPARLPLVGLPNPLRGLEVRDPAAFREAVTAGRDVYYGNCFFCHGDDLAGDGPFAAALAVRPTSFRDPGTIAILQESYLFWRIAKGGAGLPPEGTPEQSAMPAWEGVLGSRETWQVILFLYDHTGQAPRSPERMATP